MLAAYTRFEVLVEGRPLALSHGWGDLGPGVSKPPRLVRPTRQSNGIRRLRKGDIQIF